MKNAKDPKSQKKSKIISTEIKSKNKGESSDRESGITSSETVDFDISITKMGKEEPPSVFLDTKVIANRYKIIKLIGGGGMGMVYLAQHIDLDKNVAIKIIQKLPDSSLKIAEQIKNEAKAAAKLEHPNIVPVYDFGETEHYYYLVMKYIEGNDAGTILEKRGRLLLSTVIKIIEGGARGLFAIHNAGMIHRDIKPANLLISAINESMLTENEVRITDFGLVKYKEASIIVTRSIKGTPLYMSPEQVSSSQHLDHRADIYSLGATFYHLATGEPPYPWEDMNMFQLFYAILNTNPIPPRDHDSSMPIQVEKVILKMMAKDPNKRHQSMQEVIDDLQKFKASKIVVDKPIMASKCTGRKPDSEAEYGGQSAEPLIQALNNQDPKVRTRAAEALIKLGDKAVDPLIYVLKDQKQPKSVRARVVGLLGQLGDKRVLEPLILALKDENEGIRWKIVETLVKLGEKVEEPLILALKDEKQNKTVRVRAACILGELKDKKTVDPLIQVLQKERDPVVRAEVGEALGRLGDKRAVEPLLQALKKEKDSFIRAEIAVALGRLGDKRAVEPLIQALKSSRIQNQNQNVRARAACVLGELKDNRAVDPLIQVLKDQNQEVRYWAVEALGELMDKRAVDPLIKVLKDHNWLVRAEVAKVLGKLGDKRALEPLKQALKLIQSLKDKKYIIVRMELEKALNTLKA